MRRTQVDLNIKISILHLRKNAFRSAGLVINANKHLLVNLLYADKFSGTTHHDYASWNQCNPFTKHTWKDFKLRSFNRSIIGPSGREHTVSYSDQLHLKQSDEEHTIFISDCPNMVHTTITA